jgi:hypothetical protein
MTAAPATTLPGTAVRTTGVGSFHVRMAWACAAVGVIGFTPSYWLPLLTGTIVVPAIVHLHAAVFYGWLALVVTQSHLIASRRLTRHRELGVLGVAIATAMVFVGMAAAIGSMKQGVAAGFGEQARAFSVVPVTGILFFAALVGVALLNVRRPEVHRRLMLIATVSILNAAVGRLFRLAIGAPPVSTTVAPPPVVFTLMPGLLTDLLLVPALIHDKVRLGRIHRTYWIGGAALLASQLLRPVIGNSDAWQAFAGWLMRLV